MQNIQLAAARVRTGNGVTVCYKGRELDGTVVELLGDQVRVFLIESQKLKKFPLGVVTVSDNYMQHNMLHAVFGVPPKDLRPLSDVASVVPGPHGGSQLRLNRDVEAGTYMRLLAVQFSMGRADAASLHNDMSDFVSARYNAGMEYDPTAVSTGKFLGMCLTSATGAHITKYLLSSWDCLGAENMQFVLRHHMQAADYMWLAYWMHQYEGVHDPMAIVQMLFMLLTFSWVYEHTIVLDRTLCKADCPQSDWDTYFSDVTTADTTADATLAAAARGVDANMVYMQPVDVDPRQTRVLEGVGMMVFSKPLARGSILLVDYGAAYVMRDVLSMYDQEEKAHLRSIIRFDARLAAAFDAAHGK